MSNSSGVRVINGRTIERHERGGVVTWQEITRPEPIERPAYNAESGKTLCMIAHQDAVVAWRDCRAPGETIEQIMPNVWPDPLDIRESSPLHDQLERARSSGFAELAEAFSLTAKVKARPSIRA